LGAHAARVALQSAGIEATDVDLIIVATCTGDTVFPSTACHIQHKIGATRAAAFDIQAACSGFLYSLVTAEQFVASGVYDTVLVIGAEKLSSVINWQDRNTCVLFGDGAGAVVVRHKEGCNGILASDMGSDGAQTDILSLPAGGCRMPITPQVLSDRKNFLQMSGKEVYRFAVNAMIRSSERTLELAQLKTTDLAWVIPHQANIRIINTVADRLEVPSERMYVNVHRYGNTSAACIPIAMHEASTNGQLKSGDAILLVAFGGGLTWASTVLEWC
ncbi:MAG: beta-ketoacyl-ACP synthase III, partial [Candidatus Methylacidiphilales bacterium]